MKMPTDTEENSITVLINVKGKLYAKGYKFDPKKKGDLKRAARLATMGVGLSLEHQIQGAK